MEVMKSYKNDIGRKKTMCVRPFVTFRNDGVTFDGKMGKLSI